MTVSIAHLGPPGTYSEQAALAYVEWVAKETQQTAILCPYPSIAQTMKAVAQGKADRAVVPVENSIEGSVAITLDTLWQLDKLQIQLALVLPIANALLSSAQTLANIKTIYSHPQPLGQCQGWLENYLPNVQIIPTNSTTEAVKRLDGDLTAGAIASPRAAQMYNVPLLVTAINDYPDNCTRFWVIRQGNAQSHNYNSLTAASHTTMAFSVRANVPGALVKPLQVFAQRGINLSRIESRPTKRSLGDYLFFIDLEADIKDDILQSAIAELTAYTETLKIFGSYTVETIQTGFTST